MRRSKRGDAEQSWRARHSYLSPCGQHWIGQLDVDRADPKHGDHHRVLDPAGYAVIVKGACGSLDKTTSRDGHRHLRREVGATVHPPRSRHDHLDAIRRIAVGRAEPARIPSYQDQVWARLVEIAIELSHLAASRRQTVPRFKFDVAMLQHKGLVRVDR